MCFFCGVAKDNVNVHEVSAGKVSYKRKCDFSIWGWSSSLMGNGYFRNTSVAFFTPGSHLTSTAAALPPLQRAGCLMPGRASA